MCIFLKTKVFETRLKKKRTSGRKTGCLYSPSCREGSFSETRSLSTPCMSMQDLAGADRGFNPPLTQRRVYLAKLLLMNDGVQEHWREE